ncbi:MAG: calcium-binding protein [Shimia sp.]
MARITYKDLLAADLDLLSFGIVEFLPTQTGFTGLSNAVDGRVDFVIDGSGAKVFTAHEGTRDVGYRGGTTLEVDGTEFTYAQRHYDDDIAVSRVRTDGSTTDPLRMNANAPAPAFEEIAGTEFAGMALLGGFDGQTDMVHLYDMTASRSGDEIAVFRDTDKTTFADATDMLSVTSGGREYLIVSSGSDGGLTAMARDAQGALEVVDAILPQHGLWSAGLSDMVALERGGQAYIVAGSPGSDSLAVVRLNPNGVFFVEEVLTDSRDTRFGGVNAVEHIEVAGRDFILAAGNDRGLTLMEMMPDNRLIHHDTLAQDIRWDLGPTGDVGVSVVGQVAHILVSGMTASGVARFEIDLSQIGGTQMGNAGANTLSGTSKGDLLVGGAGNDTIAGGAGDDVIHAGTGADRLDGGAGADLFVFQADGQRDVISNYEHGVDRIDLGEWGMVYDISSLRIQGRDDGAMIARGQDTIRIYSDDGESLTPDMWTAEDFQF